MAIDTQITLEDATRKADRANARLNKLLKARNGARMARESFELCIIELRLANGKGE